MCLGFDMSMQGYVFETLLALIPHIIITSDIHTWGKTQVLPGVDIDSHEPFLTT